MRQSVDEKIFNIVNYIFLAIFGFASLYPFINVLAISFSGAGKVNSGLVYLIPKDVTMYAYEQVLGDAMFFNAFKISVIVTLLGTLISVAVMALAAYPLSKKDLPGRTFLMIFFIIVMLFSGGIIPNYLVVKSLGLTNTIGSLIFPSVVQVYHLLLLKNYFEALPKELEESAKIDGATALQVLVKIIVPISLPVIATVSLFTAVIYWNNYFNAMLYASSNSDVWPLPYYIYNMLEATKQDLINPEQQLNQRTIQAATIISSTVPILLVYPFMQRFFVKGVVVGSVKG